MNATTRTLSGVVRGRTIELDAETGIMDGEEVQVILHPHRGTPPSVEDLREEIDAVFGACADEAEELLEFDRITRLLRHMERRGIDE